MKRDTTRLRGIGVAIVKTLEEGELGLSTPVGQLSVLSAAY